MSNAKTWVKWIQYGVLAVFVGGLAIGYVRGDGTVGALAMAESLVLGLVLAAVAVAIVGVGWSVLGGDGNRLDDRVTGRVELALLGLAVVFVAIWVVLLGLLRRLVRDTPWFVLGERGFLYAPGDVGPGFVRSEHVTELRETEIVANSRNGRAKATPVLAVGLRDPGRYQQRYNPALRMLVRLGAKLHAAQSGGAADIVIDPTQFGGDYPKVLERMRALHARATGGGDGA